MKLLLEVLKTRTANEIQILKEGVFYAPNYFGNNWKEHMQKQGRPLELGLTRDWISASQKRCSASVCEMQLW